MMRFVDLRPDSEREGFSLHPRITVLRGLQPVERVQIVGLVHSVAMGEKSEWSGRVEVHGIRMALDDALELMGETAPAALVIDAGSLPGAAGDVSDGDDETRRSYRDAVAAREELEQEITAIADELRAAGKLRAEMQARVGSAAARSDNDAAWRLDQADGELRRAARDDNRPDPWTGIDDVAARIEWLDGLITTLDGHLENLHSGDRGALASAIATARASLVSGDVVAPRAAALSEIWMSLHQRLAGLESRFEAGDRGTDALAARLEDARTAVREVEEVVVPRAVQPSEADQVMELHDRVTDLDGRANRGVRRWAVRAQLNDAQQELTDALELLGYPTWAAYRMGNGMASVRVEAIEEYDRALTELAEAEMESAERMTRLERETDIQDMLKEIDRIHHEAVELVGSDPLARTDDHRELSRALSEVVVDASSVAVDPDDAVRHLRSALDESGALGRGDQTSAAAIVALGTSWLEVLDAADAAAVRVLRDRERAVEELTALQGLADGSRVDQLHDERAAVRAIEAEVAESRSAMLDRTRARVELHVLAMTELAMAEDHDAKVERLEAVRLLEEAAERRLPESKEIQRTPPLAARIPRGAGGPIPVVVAMGGTDARSLEALRGLPGDVQFLIVGDSPGLDEWAAQAGDGLVSVVEPGVLI